MRWRFWENSDLDWILATARNMFNESEWKDELEYDTEKIKNYFFSAISNPNIFSIVSLDESEKPTGFLTGMLLQYNFSDATTPGKWTFMFFPQSVGEWQRSR